MLAPQTGSSFRSVNDNTERTQQNRASTHQPWAIPGLSAPGGWLAFGVPALLVVVSLDGAPRWQQDVGVVRVLGQTQVGAEGIISSALGTLALLIPIGGRLFRAGLVGALACGLCSLVLYQLLLSQLSGASPRRNVHVLLALSGSLMAALGASWQLAGTQIGGPLVGALLLWVSMWLGLGTLPRWLAQGWLLGLCLAECHPVALSLLATLLARSLATRQLPRATWLGGAAAIAVATLSVCLLPALLEPLSRLPTLNFGLELQLPTTLTGAPSQSLLKEAGPYLAATAATGMISTLWQPSQRGLASSCAALVLVDLGVGSSATRVCAVAGVSMLAAQGTLFLVLWMLRRRLPFATPALRLMVLFHLGVLLMLAEEGRQSQARHATTAAGSWSDEAFERLPAGSLLLAESPEVAWRLWAGRVTRGTRPDLLLVPSRLLARGTLASDLLAGEPRLAPLIRDVAVRGIASEFALSQLADARPLRVELDPRWDRRLISHLTPAGPWLDFAPHAVGRTDRKQGLASVRRWLRNVLRRAHTSDGQDAATLDHVRRNLHAHTLVLLASGDREPVRRLLNEMDRLHPNHPDSIRLRALLRERPRGAVDLQAALKE